jgi:hypothetical protein
VGVSISAKVVVGVRLSDVLKVEEVRQAVTRYREETGEAYRREEVTRKATLFGREVDPEDGAETKLEAVFGEGMWGLLSTSGDNHYYHKDDSQAVVGVVAVKIGKGGGVGEITDEAVKKAATAFTRALRDAGLPEMPLGRYLVLDVSH